MSLSSSLSAAEKPVLSDGQLTLGSGDYKVTFSKEGEWTMDSLEYNGVMILMPSGANQTVVKLHPVDGVPTKDEFIGTKHGGEEIESLSLIVDGKSFPLEEPLDVPSGTKYQFVKVAKFGPYRGHWTVTIDASGVTESAKFESVGDLSKVAYAYVFMHCFNPSLMDWQALLKDRSIERDRFPADERSQMLKKDILALAVYSDVDKIGAVMLYPEAYQGVSGRKNFLNGWPNRHNKHYLCVSPRQLIEGEYICHIRGFSASPEDWENVAGKLMNETPGAGN